jgi:hypothetical protein
MHELCRDLKFPAQGTNFIQDFASNFFSKYSLFDSVVDIYIYRGGAEGWEGGRYQIVGRQILGKT